MFVLGIFITLISVPLLNFAFSIMYQDLFLFLDM